MLNTMHNLYSYMFFVAIVSLVIYTVLYYTTIHHKNFKKRKFNHSYYTNTILNLLFSSCIVVLISFNHHFSNHLIPKLQNILFYFIILDTIYYWCHRTTHRTPFLKKHLHAQHHTAVKSVPLDFLYNDYKENIFYSLLTIIMVLITNVSFTEFIIINIIQFLHFAYTHSESKHTILFPVINSKYHKKHHRIGGGNYSVYFTIWDTYMGTTIKKRKRARLFK